MKTVAVSGILACMAAGLVALGAEQGTTPVVRADVPTTTQAAGAVSGSRVVHKKTDQMRGFSMRLIDPTVKGVNGYLEAIDELADMGCTWVNLPVAAYQDNVKSETIVLATDDAPSDADILKIMARAKARGMGIMMMPTVLLKNTGSKDWRGVINPPNWDRWFTSYNAFVTHLARLAQKGEVDIFVVGSELLSTEPYRNRWVKTIGAIRNEYKGKLTYSANWDHYEAVTFWDQLDYVGMNNYYELAKTPGATVTELNATWKPIQEKILAFAAEQNKPFMFTEVGWHNLVNTLSEPWNYVAADPIDHGEQRRAYESFVETWKPVPKEQFMGAFIWEWYPDGKVVNGNFSRGTYSLQSTPALEVVKKWFAMP
jgi:hypothetical protein